MRICNDICAPCGKEFRVELRIWKFCHQDFSIHLNAKFCSICHRLAIISVPRLDHQIKPPFCGVIMVGVTARKSTNRVSRVVPMCPNQISKGDNCLLPAWEMSIPLSYWSSTQHNKPILQRLATHTATDRVTLMG